MEFSGLTFEHTGWVAPTTNGLVITQGANPLNPIGVLPAEVKVSYANNLRFTSNTFTMAGADGLQFNVGVSNSQIVGNQFNYLSANGIVLDEWRQKNPSDSDQTRVF